MAHLNFQSITNISIFIFRLTQTIIIVYLLGNFFIPHLTWSSDGSCDLVGLSQKE